MKFPSESNAEILCIGTELLLGNILNSNAKWLAEELALIGIRHYRQSVVGDNEKRLKQAILESKERCNILITTGGLGPTPDDITTETIASIFNIKLQEIPGLWEDIKLKLKNKEEEKIIANRRQSFFPKDAIIIPNKTGTASGMIWNPIDDFTIITFPGVPSEMKQMWKETAQEWLVKKFLKKEVFKSKVMKFTGISESKVVEGISDLIHSNNPTIAPYTSTGEVTLRITAKAKSDKDAVGLIDPFEKKLRDRFGEKYYGVNEESLAWVVINLLRQKGEKIAVAESCTGGGLGAALSEIPGASEVFIGGVIAYSNEIKNKLLGVPNKLLNDYGSVSKPVVIAMAKNLYETYNANWNIAISGIAGPTGGSREKPIGLVHIAICGEKVCQSKEFLFGTHKERNSIQKLSVVKALDQIRLLLLKKS